MKNKAEVLFLTDIHLVPENIPVVKSIFEQAVAICQEKGIKTMIFLGDFFHVRDRQPLENLNCFRQILLTIKKAGLQFYMIHGNHDQKDQNSSISYLSVFRGNGNLYSKFGSQKIGSYTYHFLPYFKEKSLYLYYLNELKKTVQDEKTILLTHQGFNGVKNNDGSVVENRFDGKRLKRYKYVLTGHYHDPSIIDGNIHYIGAAFQHNFSENNKKGFTVLYSDGRLEFHKSIYPEFVQKRILLETFTKEECRKLAEEYKDANDYVRVTFEGAEFDTSKVDKELLEEAGIDVKFVKETILTPEELTKNLVTKHTKRSLLKSFLEYSKQNSFTSSQRNKVLSLIQSKEM